MTVERTKEMAPPLAALFFVSAAAVGFEIQLTRFFSIASWSEYGYWVISIVMVGFAASGVVLSLFESWFLGRARHLLKVLPLLLVPAAVLGFYLVTLVPFNPLELQNRELWFPQVMNVWKYYVVLFPYFFLTGLTVGLYFITAPGNIPHVYAADLVGAGMGALVVLSALFLLDPAQILMALLPLLFLAGISASRMEPKESRAPWWAAALVVGLLGGGGVYFLNRTDYCQYKPLYAAQRVEGSRELHRTLSPRGIYILQDDFTERLDVDFSNNYSLLNVEGPPDVLGLYLDGNRISSFPKAAQESAPCAASRSTAF